MLDEQDDAERHHRDRQPRDQRGRREGEGAGAREHPAVGGEHRGATLGCGSMPDLEPYDALLLVSFGGPEKPDDVVPFLRNVTAGQGHPRRAARGGRRALLRVRRPQPDQRPEPRPGRRDQGRPVGQRHRPAGLLGQPQLGPLPARGTRADEGRRGDPGRGPADQRLLVVQRLPPVPREPRRRRREGPGGAADRPAAALLQPPGLRRADGRRDPRRPGRAARGRAPRRAPGLRHALDPDRDERQQRSARRRVRRPAPAGRRRDRRAGPRGDRAPLPVRARLLLAVGTAAGPVAGAGRERPSPHAPGRRECPAWW